MRPYWSALFAACSFYLLSACQSSTRTEATATLPAPTQLTGQQLSQRYCGSCHLAPAPALLDKTTWQQGVLPRMALRMGQSDRRMDALLEVHDPSELTRLLDASIFPETPTLHPDDWRKLVDYYRTLAPDKLPAQPTHAPLRTDLPLFRIHRSTQALDGIVTLLHYDSLTKQTWAGDARGHLYALDARLHRVDSLPLATPPTDMVRNPDGSLDVLTVGMLNPNDRLTGQWSHAAPTAHELAPRLLNLQRPVQATVADLNRDGRNDVVICHFGHYLGKLSWYESTGPAIYREHLLDGVPGARVTLVRDVNNDQWPDIVALLTQGDEQIAVYYNQHDGSFRKEIVQRFPSVYGSSFLELTDIDHDGDDDLIYTNGDNADYSIVLKPYHGVRIFLNDGKFRFRQAWFFPLYGASQTVTRDFDGDGDLDIATIAHFPDYGRRPSGSFVYFENRGNFTFIPRTFARADEGRWLRLEVADVDQDGDLDLLLGSFFRPVGPDHARLMDEWRRPGAGIMLLENRLKQKR